MHNDDDMISNIRLMLRGTGIDGDHFSDELLLCFIRYRKYNLGRALKSVRNYLRLTKSRPDLMANLRSVCVQKLADSVFHRVSPERDQHGRRIYIINSGLWRDDISTLDDVFRCCVYDFQILAGELETQARGLVIIFDFKNFGMNKMRDLTPSRLKIVADLVQDTFPLKIQEIHMVNNPWYVHIILSMIWPFLTQKLRGRIFLHGKSRSSLHRYVDAAGLPCDYDGHLGSFANMSLSHDVVRGRNNMFDCFDNHLDMYKDEN